jgi:L-lactate dehydrogenase complex protein LldG
MSGARDQILARLRQTLDRGQPRSVAVEQRLRERRCGPQPAWGEDLPERFCAKLTAAAGSMVRVADGPRLVAAVTDYLQAQGLPPELLLAPDPRLDALPWPAGLRLRRGPADAERVGLSWALAGVAETGSLVFASGPHTPTALNFLVDDFLCVLSIDRLVPHLEDAWQLVRAELGVLPRALNLITGPSRTADVEQTIQLGAHGPRRLHLLLLEGGG